MRLLTFLPCFALQWIGADGLIFKKNAFLPPLLLTRPGGGLRRTAFWQYTGKAMIDDVTGFKTVPQRLDHSNSNDARMWRQVYWLNSEYAEKHDGRDLVFLQVGGDSYESQSSITDGDWQIVKWAQQFGAHIYRVEHRFFDKTNAMGVTGMEALAYLTVEQAVEDVAFFAKSSLAVTHLVNPVWILFGDGYSGILASIARSLHPEIFTAAVVSSAPVHYKRAWPEFSYNMQTILGNVSIQSSHSTCDKWMGGFFDNLLKFTDDPSFRKTLNTQLQISPPLPDGDVIPSQQRWHFFASVFSVFQAFNPLTYPTTFFTFADQFTVENLCRKMFEGSGTGSFPELFNLYKWYIGDNYMDGKPSNFESWYENAVNNLKFSITKHIDDDLDQNMRWLWLSCNEVGMFPVTSTLPNSIWKTQIPIMYYEKLCDDVFTKALKKKNAPLSAADSSASNTVFVYGSLDPSRTLGRLTEDISKNIVVVDIPGVGALADLFSSIKTEPASLAPARAKISNFISGVFPWKSSAGSSTNAPVSPVTVPNPVVTLPNNPTVPYKTTTPRSGEHSTKSSRANGFFQFITLVLSVLFMGHKL